MADDLPPGAVEAAIPPTEAPAPAPAPVPALQDNPADVKAAQDDIAAITAKLPAGSQLPPVYTSMAKARAEGVSWDEINDYVAQGRQKALAGGVSNAEIDNYFQGLPLDQEPGKVQPEVPSNLPAEIGASLRNFSSKYLGPHDPFMADGLPVPGWKPTAGQITSDLGWSVVDFGKAFGSSIVNGAAATAEMFDGKTRTPWEWAQKGYEASGFLSLFIPGAKGVGATEAKTAADVIPSRQAMIDGATGLANAHPDGVTPENIAAGASVLGKNFVDTGEHPVTAAARAQADPDVMAGFHNAMSKGTVDELADEQAEATAGTASQQQYAEQAGLAEPRAAAAPEEISREGLEAPIPGEDKLLAMPAGVGSLPKSMLPPADGLDGLASGLAKNESGSVPLASFGKGIDITPSTLFQRDPVTASALANNLKAMFNPQSLDRTGAGIIRANLAQGAVANLRRSYNLQRFGRAVGELSSPARALWRRAVETGDMGPYEGTVLGKMADQMRVEKDHLWNQMNDLGIAPAYVENHLTRYWQDPDAARAVFSKRPLAGTGGFTRARFYELTQDGEEAGLKLKSDNPVELELMGNVDQQRFLDAAHILQEAKDSGLVFKIEPTEPVPDGLSPVPRNMFGRADPDRDRLYMPTNTARLLDRHMSDSLWAGSAYDAVRQLSSAGIGLKVLVDMYHPVLLAKVAMATQVGTAVKLALGGIAKGSLADIGRGLGKGVTAPFAPITTFAKGMAINRLARTGEGTAENANLLNAMMQGGMRFGADARNEISSAGSGGFWQSIHGMLDPSTGLATPRQEIAQMMRDAAPIKMFGHEIAPGYFRAIAQILPRVFDSIRDPLMRYAVPNIKTGINAAKMQEAMRAHPNMGLSDLRYVAGRISDETDNLAGEMIQDNLGWNKTATDTTRLLSNFPTWVYGKLRFLGGTAADVALHGGLQKGAEGTREISDHLTNMVGVIATAAFTSMIYGKLNGTYNSGWSWKDYMAPPNSNGTRVSVPGIEHYVYNWLAHPETTAADQLNWIPQMLDELGNNRQFDGAAIHDPQAPMLTQAKEFGSYLYDQIAPMILHTSKSPDVDLTTLDKVLNAGQAPYALRQPEKEQRYETQDEKKAVAKLHREEQQ